MIESQSRRPAQMVGEGSAQAIAHERARRRTIVVVDDAVVARAEHLQGDFVGRHTVTGPTTLADAASLARAVVATRAERILAIGGGNVIDLAKLAAIVASRAGAVEFLGARGGARGFVVLPALGYVPVEVQCVPTTFGTGAEVSSVACVEQTVAGRAWTGADPVAVKTLVALPWSPVSAVAYDSVFLDGPPWLVREGLFEAAARLITTAVGARSRIRVADAQLDALLGCLAQMTELARGTSFRPSPELVVDMAVASAETHVGWALRGRGVAPSLPWFLSNELSMAARVRKNVAMAVVMPAWAESVRRGNVLWGDRSRLEHLDGVIRRASCYEGCDELLDGAAPLDRDLGLWPADSARLAARTYARFGAGWPIARAVAQADIESLFQCALGGVTVPGPGAPVASTAGQYR